MKIMNVGKFVTLCKQTQKELRVELATWLSTFYDEVVIDDGFVYAKGSDPILLTAHMDTVHKVTCRKVNKRRKNGMTILSSPDGIGGDDRCGIYMIQRIVETTKLRPSILFCEDEEVGGVGSSKFCKTEFVTDLSEMLFLVELDRANAKDIVFYDDANKSFHAFCEEATGYVENYGSFSDISHLCPVCGISGVNISCGYYNAHTLNEYVVFEEMENSIQAVIKLMTDGLNDGTKYEYEEAYSYYNYGSLLGDDEGYYDRYEQAIEFAVFFLADGTSYQVNAKDYYEAVAKLMMENPTLTWNDVIDWDFY